MGGEYLSASSGCDPAERAESRRAERRLDLVLNVVACVLLVVGLAILGLTLVAEHARAEMLIRQRAIPADAFAAPAPDVNQSSMVADTRLVSIEGH